VKYTVKWTRLFA